MRAPNTRAVRANALAAEVVGAGPALLMLPGLPFDRTMWAPVAERLAVRWTVVTYDLRGLGEARGLPGPYDIARHAADAVALLDRLGIARAGFVGASFGGYVALEALRSVPERMDHLILVGAAVAADNPDARAQRLTLADEIACSAELRVADDILAWLFSPLTAAKQPALVSMWRERMERESPATVAEMMRSLATRADSRDLVRSSPVPVAAILGQRDETVDAAIISHDVAGRIRIVDAGHMMALEAPDATAAAIEELLSLSDGARA